VEYTSTSYIRLHGVGSDSFSYGKQDAIIISNTYCNLLNGCFDTFVYLFHSEYVRHCTQWVSN